MRPYQLSSKKTCQIPGNLTNSFPTVFVLDPVGVIRHKGHRAEELNRAVAELMTQAESAVKR